MPTQDNRDANLSELKDIVGDQYVLLSKEDQAGFVEDWRKRYHGVARAVVRPKSTAEVSKILEWAYRNHAAIVPQGGNTGMLGGAIPSIRGDEIILSLTRLRTIRDVDVTNDAIVAEAGCTLLEIQEAAEKVNRLFPLSLGSEGTCQIGGNIATNAGGLDVVRYGPMRDLVLGLEVVLPDGEVLEQICRLRKNNTGYDLKHLFIGSEGTLGIITAAALKLYPLPKTRITSIAGLASPEYALIVLRVMKEEFGARLSTIEILSGLEMRLTAKHCGITPPLRAEHGWYLLIELTEATADDLLADNFMTALHKCIEDGVVEDATVAQNESQRAQFWKLRHMVAEANNAAGRVLSHDTSVPVSEGARFIRKVEAAFAGSSDLKLVFVGHIGDGNIHAVAIFDRAKVPDGIFEDRAKEVSSTIFEIAIGLDGSISAEHGIGFSLRDRLKSYKQPREWALMRAIKSAFDPKGLLNPGKVFAETSADE